MPTASHPFHASSRVYSPQAAAEVEREAEWRERSVSRRALILDDRDPQRAQPGSSRDIGRPRRPSAAAAGRAGIDVHALAPISSRASAAAARRASSRR